jgi:hypothetical protein
VLTYSIYMWSHEPCLFGWIKGQKPFVDRKYGNPGTVWQVPNAEIESSEHPTSKPNRLFAIPMSCTLVPTIFATSLSPEADRNSLRPSSLGGAAMRSSWNPAA